MTGNFKKAHRKIEIACLKYLKNYKMKLTVLLVAVMGLLCFSSVKGEKKVEKKITESTTVNSLSGTIADEITGETLVGVKVSIDGMNVSTYTDFDGCFKFENVKEGEYTVSASLISYQIAKSKKITVDTSSSKKISLKMKKVN